jgi:hypothetical protein
MGTKNLGRSGPSITEMPLTGFKRDEDGYYRMITRASTKEMKGNKIIRGKEEVSQQRYEMSTADDYLYKFDVTTPGNKKEMQIYFRKVIEEE